MKSRRVKHSRKGHTRRHRSRRVKQIGGMSEQAKLNKELKAIFKWIQSVKSSQHSDSPITLTLEQSEEFLKMLLWFSISLRNANFRYRIKEKLYVIQNRYAAPLHILIDQVIKHLDSFEPAPNEDTIEMPLREYW